MAQRDLRSWMARIDAAGELKRIEAEVDWDLELSAIARRVENREGPALLFENIRGYRDTVCRRLFIGGLGSRQRLAMSLGLPRETGFREIVEFIRGRIGQLVSPVKVASGPVKENIIRGDAVNLYQFPVPKYAPLDGGRYINTRGCVVTMDPDTGIMNVGMYRGMLGDDEKSIPSLLLRTQHWGLHFAKYRQRGEDMPVAVVHGWDPTLTLCASTPIQHHGYSEYEVMGALCGEPVELVKCETSDLYVPASAEIVLEGRISPDPKTFQTEGPLGEYHGFYAGMRHPRPTIHVDCITYRNDPIFRGGLSGTDPTGNIEVTNWMACFKAGVIWKALETAGVPGILGVWGSPTASLTNLRFQIDKLYREHAMQVATAFTGISNISIYSGKTIIVVDKDIDIFNDAAVEWAIAWRANAQMGAVRFIPETRGMSLDPSVPLEQRDELKYGGGRWTRVLIDATVNWDLEPQAQYGGKREPPRGTEILPETAELVNRRWHEYGF